MYFDLLQELLFEKKIMYSFIVLHTDVDKVMIFQKIEILSSNYHLRVIWIFFFHILNKSLYIILGNTVTLKCSDKMSSTYWS